MNSQEASTAIPGVTRTKRPTIWRKSIAVFASVAYVARLFAFVGRSGEV